MAKTRYPYSKELKKPASFGAVDYEKAMLEGGMRKAASFMGRQATSYKCSKSKLGMISIPGSDGCSISCYTFTPSESQMEAGPYPALIYYHGGGFMFPIQRMMMANSDLYAGHAGVKVFLPDFRLSLDVSCQLIVEDCMSVLRYVVEHADELDIDPDRIVLYGDSAGGALASTVAIWNRDEHICSPRGMMLAYPVCDNESWRYPSIDAYSEAAWSKCGNESMWRVYLGHGCDNVAKYVPMKGDVSAFPPTYIEVAEIDTLRDEGIAFAKHLADEGVNVDCRTVPGAYHGYDADLKSRLVQDSLARRYEAIVRFVS